MNEWERMQKLAEMYKEEYPPGTRLELMKMGDDPRPIEANTRGTVVVVDDIGTVHCDFDNGRSLGLVPGEDSFRKLTPEEIEAERQSVDVNEDNSPMQTMLGVYEKSEK